jgi:hypothetical protein
MPSQLSADRLLALPLLERLTDLHPLREDLRSQMMVALYRSGRQADACAVFTRTREILVEELGIEPSPSLQNVFSAILRQDPALAAPSGVPAPVGLQRESVPESAVTNNLPAELTFWWRAVLVADELMVLGATGQSWAWHQTSKTAADATDDPALRAHVRTPGALLPLYYGDPAVAVALTREARNILSGAMNPSRAMAPALDAYALTRLGDNKSSTQALQEAAAAFEGLRSQDRGESVLGFSERRWRFYVSRIVSHLASVSTAPKTLADALAAQSDALTLYPPDVVGDPALIQLDRAVCLVRLADIPEGCELAGTVLGHISAKCETEIIRRRARDVLAGVPRRHQNLGAVRDYEEALAAFATTR